MTDHPGAPTPRRRLHWLTRYELSLTMGLLVLLFGLAFFWSSVVIAIPSGFRGVLWSRVSGTATERVYREGTHVILPWDQMVLYDVRFQAVDRTFTILSSDGLPIEIDLTVRFKPSEQQIGNLHAKVGPGYATTIVAPEIAAALRAVVGGLEPEALYGANFDVIQQQIFRYAEPQIGQRHVILDDILVRKITLPPTVYQAIERKFQSEQASQEMEFKLTRERQEADRKILEANGIQEFNRLVGTSLTELTLQYKGIEATLELARSNNAKVIVIGGSRNGLPLILNTDGTIAAGAPAP